MSNRDETVNGPWNLREEHLYTEQLKQFGDHSVVDEALRGLLWGLATDPEAFDEIPNTRLRLAKSEPVQQGDQYIPRLRIWFTLDRGPNHAIVSLLSIEAEPEDRD